MSAHAWLARLSPQILGVSTEGDILRSGLGLVEMRAGTPAGASQITRSLVRVLALGQRHQATRRRPREVRLPCELKYLPAVASMYQTEGPANELSCCILLV